MRLSDAEQININDQLFKASSDGNITMFDEALRNGAQINAKSGEGLNVSHLAALNGKIDMYDHAVGQKGFVSGADINGSNAALMAVWGGHLDTVEHLVENHSMNVCQENNFQMTALKAASEKPKILAYIEKVVAANDNLLVAASIGDIEKLEEALTAGAQLHVKNNGGMDASVMAASNGKITMFDYLVNDKGFDPESVEVNGYNTVMVAVFSKQEEMAKHLVENYSANLAHRNNAGQNVEFVAGQSLVVSTLEYVQKTDALNNKLLLAASEGNIEDFEDVLSSGAQLHVKNHGGMDVFLLASFHGKDNMINHLVNEKKFSTEGEEVNGYNAVMLAVLGKHDTTVRNLVEIHSANVLHTNNAGESVEVIAGKTLDVRILQYVQAEANKQRLAENGGDVPSTATGATDVFNFGNLSNALDVSGSGASWADRNTWNAGNDNSEGRK